MGNQAEKKATAAHGFANVETAKFLLKVALTLAILAGCFTLVDFDSLVDALTRADPIYLGTTFIITVIGSIVVPSYLTWNSLIHDRISLSLGRLIMINFALRFYMLVLPRPVSIGMRWSRYRHGGRGMDALALMIFERLVQLLVYSCTTVVLLGCSLDQLPAFGQYIWFASILVFLMTVTGIMPFFSVSASRLLGRFVTISEKFIPAFLARSILKLLDAVGAFQTLKMTSVLVVIGCSLTSFVLLIAGSWVLMQTMDFSISLIDLAWIRSVVFIVTQVPITIGGIGLREASFISLLHMYGVAEYDALAYSLMFLWIHIVIGLIGVASEGIQHLLQRHEAG